ncbi:MAG: hypothetical protein LBL95_06010, partial [Deltaproteobacteria bacterium]|nr:hypothetical protein [Deltaproteobacteria bacterium]
GFYDYSSRASDKVVREISVTSSPDGPSSVELVPPRAGFYWVKASLKDDQGRANESSVSFYVHGDGPVGWLPSRDEGLTLIPDREAYAPGDTARILVQSPFSEAQALVTVERSGVREASLVDVQGQTPILEIPIGPDDGPNLFVSVILSRGRIAEEPDDDNVDLGKPATRKGYLSLRIPSKADILSVDVQTDAEIYAPGDEVRVNIRVAGQDGAEAGESEIALAVVDATLVQLLGDGGYFPDRIFSSDRPLSVLTVNPISILMGRRNLALKGGVDAGGGALALAEARARARADDPRSDFRNLAFFEPRVPVSPDGTAHVSFSLPDNLTTFKIYAVATGHGRLSGTGQKDFLVTKDVLLRPSLPAYSSLGDDFVAAATVTNRSDKPGQAKVSLSADNVEMVDAFSEKEVSLAPGQSLEVGFQVKASVLGTAGFTFSVDMDGKTDSARYEIPVVPVNALVTQASYRQLSPGLTPIDLALPEGLDQHRGGLSLELSPSLVGLLAGPLAFLRDYPHACMEQLTSKALGHLISIRLRERLGLSPEEVAQAEARVREHIALVASSNKEGGYDPWPGTFGWEGRSPVVSAYVLEFLLEARDADFDVPSGLIGDAIGYLSSVIGDPKANSRDWYGPEAIDSMTAYAAMVLARSGEPVSSFLEVLFLRRETLPLADLVNLIRGLGYLPPSASRSQMLRDAISLLQNSLSLAPGQAHFSEVPRSPWIWADNDKLTAMALLALCQTAPHNEFIPQLVRDLVSRASRGSFSSTQSNVHALLALSSYLALAEPEDPNLSISATLGDKELLSAVFRSPLSPPARATEPISALPGAKTLDISSEGTGEAWATVRLSFAPLAPDLSADNPSSLSISRSYSILRPEASSPGLSSFKRGQVVQVTVTLMTPEDRHDLVLEDRIPAGFETINLRFLSEDQTLVPGTDPESTGWKYTDSFWFDHQEIWPDRVSVYADFLPAGVYTFSYLVRPVTLGTYQVPGPRAEEMYSPEVYGRGPGQTLSVVPADSN